mgnify:CR=1 FL=1
MIRACCWILALCTFCVILFFRTDRCGAADRDKAAKIAWTFAEAPKADTPLPKTYAEARERSLRTGLPLVVWVGEAVCPGCVQRTKEEYVHWVTQSFPDTPKDALVVGIPQGGDLIRIGTMTAWPDGHLTTIAKALDLWRTHRQTTDQRATAYRGGQVSQSTYSGYNQKASVGRSRGVFRSRASGGCST